MTHLVDSSAWIDYLRGADTPARDGVRHLLRADEVTVVMAEPVAMELLAGPSDAHTLGQLTKLVDSLPPLELDVRLDFRAAASIFRACRVSGARVRNLSDCLVAAIAIRHDVTLAHTDSDFDSIAAVTPLQTLSWR